MFLLALKKIIFIISVSLFINSCATSGTEYVQGVGSIKVEGPTRDNKIAHWNYYKSIDYKYKVYALILGGPDKGFHTWAADTSDLDGMLKTLYSRDTCSDGCLVTHLGIREISDDEQLEIAKKYMPKYMVEAIFNKKEKKQVNENENENITGSMGTGFLISNNGYIITNHHVIDGCNQVDLVLKGKKFKGNVIASDKINDLAIITSQINQNNYFFISNEDAALLQNIMVAGYPLGQSLSSSIKIHKGAVTALSGFSDNYSNFQTDATINPGNSGGPIIDEKGNIVGVAVALLSVEAAQNIFFGIKSSTLKTFINSNNLKLSDPNDQKKSNQELAKLITNSTIYIECII